MVMVAEGAVKFGIMVKLGCRKAKNGWLMDGVVMKQCSGILKKLMTHQAGWIFNQPVDPVKLKIPDYFSIISEPMDLGTIQYRLVNGLYFNTEEFAADVRLTFSNAMRYNPPHNDVHIIAKELRDFFNMRWKSLEAIWRGESSITSEQPTSKKTQKQTLRSRRTSHKTSSRCSNSSPRRSMTSAEKQILRKDLAILLDGDAPPHLLKILRKFDPVGRNRDRIEVDFDALDDKVLWELDKIIRSYPEPTSTKSTDVDNRHGCNARQKFSKGKGQSNSSTCCKSKNYAPTLSASACINDSCDSSTDCHSGLHNPAQISSSGRKDHAFHGDAFNLDHLACNNTAASTQRSNCDPDSDGGKGFSFLYFVKA